MCRFAFLTTFNPTPLSYLGVSRGSYMAERLQRVEVAYPCPLAVRRQAAVPEEALSKQALRMKTCEDMFEKIVDYVEGELTS